MNKVLTSIINKIRDYLNNFMSEYDKEHSLPEHWKSPIELLFDIDTKRTCTCNCIQQFCMIHKTDYKYHLPDNSKYKVKKEQRDFIWDKIDILDDISRLQNKYRERFIQHNQ